MTPEPQLDMLWESVDPADALTTRFGFTDAARAASWLAETVEEAWALRVDTCDRLVISARKLLAWITVDGSPLVAKCGVDSALFSRLADVDTLTAWLHGEGIAVAPPIVASDNRTRVEHGRFSIGLYPLVVGDLLDADDPAQVDAAGRTLATLHHALAAYPRSFAGRAVKDQQLTHGDFRSANILVRDGGITAVLDFDEASYRTRATELAHAAVLLGTRYHDWQPTSPATRETFVSAYDDAFPLTSAQRAEFDSGVIAVSAHFGWT
jgi:homoserine kinase type II